MRGGIVWALVLAAAGAADGAVVRAYALTGDEGATLHVDVDYVGTSLSVLGVTVDVLHVHLRCDADAPPGEPFSPHWPAAVDLAFTGTLYQIYRSDLSPPPPKVGYTPDPVLGAGLLDAAHDTRFMTVFDGTVTIPDETNDCSLGLDAGSDYHGWGTKLGGYLASQGESSGSAGRNLIAGLPTTSMVKDLLLAQIVVPSGGSAVLEGRVSARDGERFDFGADLVIAATPIPEPAAMALLALCAAAWTRRRAVPRRSRRLPR